MILGLSERLVKDESGSPAPSSVWNPSKVRQPVGLRVVWFKGQPKLRTLTARGQQRPLSTGLVGLGRCL